MRSFLEEVTTDLTNRFSSDFSSLVLVLNNRRPLALIQHHLYELDQKTMLLPQFMTIQEFISSSSNLLVADPLLQFFVLLQEWNLLLGKEGRSGLSPSEFYPVAEIILHDFSQLDQERTDVNQIFRILEDISDLQDVFDPLAPEQIDFLKQFWSSFQGKQGDYQKSFKDFWKRMPALYSGFHRSLEDRGMTTMAQLYRKLSEPGAPLPLITESKKTYVFIGFNALNQSEKLLLKRLQNEGSALFYFDSDPYYMSDRQQEAGRFLRENIVDLGLINAFPEAGMNIPFKQKSDDNAFERKQEAESAASGETLEREIILTATQGYTEQAKSLPLIVDFKNALAQSGLPEKTAIVLADESLMIPVLQTLDPELELNVTMGYPLTQSPLFSFISLWLRVQEYLLEKKSVPVKEAEEFSAHPLSNVREADRQKLIQKIIKNQTGEIPLSFMKNLSSLGPNFFSSHFSALEAIDALYVLLTAALEQRQKKKELQQLEANLILEVCKKLNQLYDSLELYAADLSLPFVSKLIAKVMSAMSVPLEGNPLKGIQMMGLLETRNLDFEEIIFLGMNEGIFPSVHPSPSYIPENIKKAYNLPVLENQNALAAYVFYRLLKRTKKIRIVYNAIADKQNSGELSRFLRQLQYESGFIVKTYDQNQGLQIFSAPPVSVRKDVQVWQKMQSYLKMPGEDGFRTLSATAFSTYLNCSLQFFFRYIADIKEPEQRSLSIEANQFGSMLHQIMEWFYASLASSGSRITSDRIEASRHEIVKLALRAMANELGIVGNFIPGSMQKIILRILEEYAYTILEHDRELAPFEIISLELEDQFVYSYPIDLDGQIVSVNLSGKIDRVDQIGSLTRIIDYKTGNDSIDFKELEDLFDRARNKPFKALTQTLYYTLIYEKATGRKKVQPNLYVLRRLKKEGTLFHKGSGAKLLHLQDDILEEFKADFERNLEIILKELFNREYSFTQVENEQNCLYCPYQEICQRRID